MNEKQKAAGQSWPDAQGHFGDFGGKFVPETLIPAINELETVYLETRNNLVFQQQLQNLLRGYSGRPTPPVLRPASF